MGELTVIGVRHHSPACARLVAHAIDALSPRFVLIEGPSDMNGRLDEMLAGHILPIAIYTYALGDAQQGPRGTWAPFCDYSPEWVALHRGRDCGAEVHFIDLPAWDDAFAATLNRYSDAELYASDQLGCLAQQLGFDSTDALWDHLFEQTRDFDTLQRELSEYFAALRGNEDARGGDGRRETWMAQWIAWAMAQTCDEESVLVVCGGYHKPALEASWRRATAHRPVLEIPEQRVGNYLVPFSFTRLDGFSGYAAGMPSPAFYQARWEKGDGCADAMLLQAIDHLRRKRQPVSTADALAASQLAHGLARIRGHALPLRTDLLDGLVGALLKDALTYPVPWTVRSPILPGTDPLVAELMAAFCGDAQGALAPDTPQPHLVHDIATHMQRTGLVWSHAAITIAIDPFDATDVSRRQVLHRLAILGIPGVTLVRAVDLRRGELSREERWQLHRLVETEPMMIERAVYGATLEQAAAACLMQRLQTATGVAAIAIALESALLAGYSAMAADFADSALEVIHKEPVFAEVGAALDKFCAMRHASDWGQLAQSGRLVELVVAACERAVWLLEGIQGTQTGYYALDVRGVVALRNCLREPDGVPAMTVQMVSHGLKRCVDAIDMTPALRGAALGALWSLGVQADASLATSVAIGMPDTALGDFLSGLLPLAREAFAASSLLEVIDARLRNLDEEAFLVALPALRHAFSFFPPRERLVIARRLVGQSAVDISPEKLLRSTFAAANIQQAVRLQLAVWRIADSHGLLGDGR